MPRDYQVYLEDILEAISKIAEFTKGFRLETFSDDAKTMDAAVRNLEVIGEAIKKIPDDVKHKHPEIEWKKIAGLRDILIHEYFGVDIEIVWDIIQSKLPELKKKIKSLLKDS
jgi:uncharacterized protein with HEPN domain